jgi:hypothetical protein
VPDKLHPHRNGAITGLGQEAFRIRAHMETLDRIMRGVVRKALEGFLSVFDGYALADIAGNRTALVEMLGCPPRLSKPA